MAETFLDGRRKFTDAGADSVKGKSDHRRAAVDCERLNGKIFLPSWLGSFGRDDLSNDFRKNHEFNQPGLRFLIRPFGPPHRQEKDQPPSCPSPAGKVVGRTGEVKTESPTPFASS
jgi:hypothetical protein